jgi:hypothetical protein
MQFSYPMNQRKAPIKTMTSFILPCPLEDHDMFLETKLDDGNIATIGRVLEIEAHELVFLLLKPFLEHRKKTLDFGTVVRVDDLEIGRAMCEHVPVASSWIHGGGCGKEERRGRRTEMEDGQVYCSVALL